MLIQSAQFVAGATGLSNCPDSTWPEIAFAGRSNVGKSSLINTLLNRRGLVRTSSTPGRTQMLNFFAINDRLHFVDLPGYGFAKVDDATRSRWDTLVGGYLQSRRMLVGVVLVMDARRPLMPADRELLHWLMQRDEPARMRLHLLLSKADQLDRKSVV